MGNVIKATRSKSGGGVQGLKHSFVTKLAISLEVVVWEYQQRGFLLGSNFTLSASLSLALEFSMAL